MNSLSTSPSRRSRLIRAAAGLGAATAMLGTAGVAMAAPTQHAASTPVVQSAAAGASIQLPAGKVEPGSRITITGDAPLNARAGQRISLSSVAFASTRAVNGIPTISTQINAQGTYSATATIKSGIQKYNDAAVVGSFQGRQFNQVAWMHLNAGLNGTLHVVYHNARGTTAAGSKVILVGDSPSTAPGGLRSGDRLTFDSKAFSGPLTATISAQGTYRINATIAKDVKPGTYSVNGSYRGMPFKSSSSVKVAG
jgi:hypothetical protein